MIKHQVVRYQMDAEITPPEDSPSSEGSWRAAGLSSDASSHWVLWEWVEPSE